jgi:hypothetical protein
MSFTTRNPVKIPIKRNHLFYGEQDFKFEEDIFKTYLEQDINQTLIYYEVDLEKTNLDKVYSESKKNGIVFKTPIEFHCLYNIDEPETKPYDNSKNMGINIKPGKLTFEVMNITLSEHNINPKIGDYIGVVIDVDKIVFYQIESDFKVNYDNLHTLYGYKPISRSYTCSWVDPNQFDGK